MMASSQEEEKPSARIDQSYYETSGYFEKGGRHLVDPDSSFQRYRIREVLKLCGDVSGNRAVDLGCGWGTVSFALAENAEAVVGVDFAEASLRLCRSRLDSGRYPNLSFIQADASRTGLPGSLWDLVVAADLIEHLYPTKTLEVYREANRLLRPGGCLVIWTPAPTHILEWLRRRGVLRADPSHVDYKTLPRIHADIEECGLRVIRAGYAASHLPILSIIERVGQRWVGWLQRRIAVVAIKPSNR
jgi:2-polyprenyl-3-methyl-5-hydroxy-6-metoxy-1,4-benzoquinol methylase